MGIQSIIQHVLQKVFTLFGFANDLPDVSNGFSDQLVDFMDLKLELESVKAELKEMKSEQMALKDSREDPVPNNIVFSAYNDVADVYGGSYLSFANYWTSSEHFDLGRGEFILLLQGTTSLCLRAIFMP